MLKKIAIGFGIFVGIILIAAFVLLYSNDSFEAVLTEVPAAGINESDYLTRSEVDGNTVLTYPLDTTYGLKPNRVLLSEGAAQGNDGLFVKHNGDGGVFSFAVNDDDTIAIVEGSDFHNGIIEVEVNGSVSTEASRIVQLVPGGFVGVCFRVDDNAESFECFYLRPGFGTAVGEESNNQAVQYISIPDWDFAAMRAESPDKYESAAPISHDTWHTVRIEVEDATAKLFIDGGSEPVIVIDDLKLGADGRGQVGLWTGVGSNAFFRNLTVTVLE